MDTSTSNSNPAADLEKLGINQSTQNKPIYKALVGYLYHDEVIEAVVTGKNANHLAIAFSSYLTPSRLY